MKERLLYLCHIPWEWIPQRPQFVAKYLSKYFNITVVYPKSLKFWVLVKNKDYNLKKYPIYKIPYTLKKVIPFGIDILNRFLIKAQLHLLIKRNRPQILWFTHPYFFEFIADEVNSYMYNMIVYDCMDDYLAFPDIKNQSTLKNKLFNIEKMLCHISDVIFVSSNVLKERLIERYNIIDDDKIFVINNGYEPFSENTELPFKIKKNLYDNTFKLVYIGTISKWLDWELIAKILKKYRDIKVILVGPYDTKQYFHERLIYTGPILHDYLFNIMIHSDVLIMPFILDELIEAVDPVKIYEYLLVKKPVIAKRYRETEKFKDCIYLYSTHEEFFSILDNLKKDQKRYNSIACEKIIHNSSWEKRVEEMYNIILRKISKPT